MPSATNTITINRPPDAVFALLADGTTGPRWRPGILDLSVARSQTGTSLGHGLLVRIDPATNTIDRVLKPSTPFGGGGGILVVAGSVWVTDGWNGVVLRFPLAAFGA